jgi:hypothetical protein
MFFSSGYPVSGLFNGFKVFIYINDWRHFYKEDCFKMNYNLRKKHEEGTK